MVLTIDDDIWSVAVYTCNVQLRVSRLIHWLYENLLLAGHAYGHDEASASVHAHHAEDEAVRSLRHCQSAY